MRPAKGVSLADTPKRGAAVIYDDTAAAVPLDEAAGYDLGTCDQKHQRMAAHQAQRIDALEQKIAVMQQDISNLLHLITTDKIPNRLAALEATIRQWSAGR